MWRAAALVALTALSVTAGCAQAHPGKGLAGVALATPARASSSHVVVLVMENAQSSDVLGNRAAPYTNSLVRRYGLAAQSYAITHPSLPNYLALTSASTQRIDSDCTECHTAGANIVDQLEAARISWRAYLEDVPGPCFRGAGAGSYARKHNPFIYYDDIARSAARCRKLVGFGQLAADVRHGRLPTYAWVTPNLCDDGHDCGVSVADRFLARTVPALIRSLGPHGFLVLTWDEGSSDAGCCGEAAHGGHIATIVAGPDVRRGAREAAAIDHYGVLGTIEESLRLPPLGGARDPRSGRLRALFTRPPRIR